jgi:hypothetical protein
MKLYFKRFIKEPPKQFMRGLETRLSDKFLNEKMCQNCRKRIYNRLSRNPYFCAQHLTPIYYYEVCAYFAPTWAVLL